MKRIMNNYAELRAAAAAGIRLGLITPPPVVGFRPGTKTCDYCGAQYRQQAGRGAPARYCSPECSGRARYARKPKPEPRMATCRVCAAEYRMQFNSVCCSPECRYEYKKRV